MKTFLFRSMIGIFFGAFLSVIITNLYVLSNEHIMLDGTLFLKNSLGSIFCGWFFTVSALYFENPNLRLSQQTALHFVTVIILYFVLAFVIGWIPFNLISFLFAVGFFICFYLIFWTSFYLYFKRQMKKLNEELELL
ncbi:DUF3021 domain-containing protein [Bacillus sp. FJAT-22090]|uniref:DUF3021 domain-containing protein n=1 Tax=Bacillus sp. FJAT-22090 TaxID=1581038 RepID=UPI0011A72963|nr:DUF3021 domain-containing protein [Bacillus sp. FJAT-22090]